MTDKIITTFETTLTWFKCNDKLPNHEEKVLITFTDDPSVIMARFLKHFSGQDGLFLDYSDSQSYWGLNKILWWTYLPEFE